MRTRTLAREAALQYLYEVDVVGLDEAEPIEAFLERQLGRAEAREYAGMLIMGALDSLADIDKTLERCSENWALNRMAIVDRNVLRLGAYELLHSKDVPHKVAINEAINLSRRFSTEESCAFVNGILDRIREMAPDGPPDGESEEPRDA
jgi:transcription antitermination factor NusB